jgi:uncharacterized protein
MTELRLSEIWIYPIKSLAGVRLTEANVLEKGLEYDRRWMLVDETGRFITQREHPKLALFEVTLEAKHLFVRHRKTHASHRIPLTPHTNQSFSVTIWRDDVQALEVSAETSRWFSEQLNTTCRLVYFPEEHARPVDPEFAVNHEHVSLADAYPFLVIGQASLDDLNTRLPESITMRRFRPNFVFTGGEPYEEDHWKDFSIGNIHFRGVKNCSRCVLTTVDPETGTTGIEPLRTLATYRNLGGKVNFGQLAVTRAAGVLNEGDKISLT